MVTGTDIFSNVKVSESGRYCIRFYHPHHLQHFARFTTWVGEHFDRTKSPRKTASGYRYDTNTTANTGRVKHVIVILSTYRIGIGRIQNQEQYCLERAYLKAALNRHKNEFFQREVLLMLWYNYLSELYEMYSSDPFEKSVARRTDDRRRFHSAEQRINAYCYGAKS